VGPLAERRVGGDYGGSHRGRSSPARPALSMASAQTNRTGGIGNLDRRHQMADVNDFESDSVSWVAPADVPPLIGPGDITSGTTLAALYVIVSGH
jgi:hypothetical protein